MDTLKTSIIFVVLLLGVGVITDLQAGRKRTHNRRKANLFTAVTDGDENRVKELLSKKDVSVHTLDKQGRTPWLAAIEADLGSCERGDTYDRRKYVGVLSYLALEGSDFNARNKSGKTALIQVLEHGRFDFISIFLSIAKHSPERLDLLKAPSNGLTARELCNNYIQEAFCKKSDLRLKEVEEGADVTQLEKKAGEESDKDAAWRSVEEELYALEKNLFTLIKNSNYKEIKSVMKDRPHSYATDAQGNTPFICAIKKLCVTSPSVTLDLSAEANIVLLLAPKSDVNAMDQYGDTPLAMAARQGRADIFNFLFDNVKGINANQGNLFKELMYSAMQSKEDPNKEDYNREKVCFMPMINALCAKGVFLNHPDPEDGSTALMEAVELNKPQFVKFLVGKLSTDELFTSRKHDTKTAFHLAIEDRKEDLFKTLVDGLDHKGLDKLLSLDHMHLEGPFKSVIWARKDYLLTKDL